MSNSISSMDKFNRRHVGGLRFVRDDLLRARVATSQSLQSGRCARRVRHGTVRQPHHVDIDIRAVLPQGIVNQEPLGELFNNILFTQNYT
jgi:hypothetical protein